MSSPLAARDHDNRVVVAEFFDRRADAYDDSYVTPGPGRHVLHARMDATLELIGQGNGDALDVGMGAGRLCEALAARGWTVSGVDLSRAMVHRAQSRFPAAADRLRCGAVERLPFANSSFDALSATGMFEYVYDLPSALAELARVLRPRGRAVLSIPNRNAPYRYSRLLWDPMARFARRAVDPSVRRTPPGAGGRPASQFVSELHAAGFQVTAVRQLGAMVVPAPLDSLIPVVAERRARAAEQMRWSRRVLGTQLVFAATKTGG